MSAAALYAFQTYGAYWAVAGCCGLWLNKRGGSAAAEPTKHVRNEFRSHLVFHGRLSVE